MKLVIPETMTIVTAAVGLLLHLALVAAENGGVAKALEHDNHSPSAFATLQITIRKYEFLNPHDLKDVIPDYHRQRSS